MNDSPNLILLIIDVIISVLIISSGVAMGKNKSWGYYSVLVITLLTVGIIIYNDFNNQRYYHTNLFQYFIEGMDMAERIIMISVIVFFTPTIYTCISNVIRLNKQSLE